MKCFLLLALGFWTLAAQSPPTVSLDQAVREAIANNLELAAARYDISVAEARQITAGLRPNPVMTLSADHLDVLGTGYNTINNAGPNDVVVYIVRGTNPILAGCAAHPPNRPGALVAFFANGWTIAHEVGHHVQNLTGVLRRSDAQELGPQGGAVRIELQADCLAGVWVANALRTGFIEELTRADIEDALSAAAAVGDDRIQERVQGRVEPESWTHGSAEQRQSWFVRGIEGGSANACNTFEGRV